jgi:hypothetical protein
MALATHPKAQRPTPTLTPLPLGLRRGSPPVPRTRAPHQTTYRSSARSGRGGHSSLSRSGGTPSVVAGFEGRSDGTSSLAAGFAGPESGGTPAVVGGFGGHTPGRPPGRRTATPAALRYWLAVSRRTPVDSSIRRSDQPSRPSVTTCCLLSSLKTLAIPAQEHDSHACVNSSGAYLVAAGFQVPLSGRLWAPPGALEGG